MKNNEKITSHPYNTDTVADLVYEWLAAIHHLKESDPGTYRMHLHHMVRILRNEE